MRAKSEADAAVRAHTDLDWTIVRPGSLTDDAPTGRLQVGDSVSGSISRADVAQLLADLIASGRGVHRQFEVVAGDTAFAELEL